MKIYHYHEKTGLLLGEGMADPSPLEPGNWLIPAHATNVEPPEHVEGSTRHFVAGGWEYQEAITTQDSTESGVEENGSALFAQAQAGEFRPVTPAEFEDVPL